MMCATQGQEGYFEDKSTLLKWIEKIICALTEYNCQLCLIPMWKCWHIFLLSFFYLLPSSTIITKKIPFYLTHGEGRGMRPMIYHIKVPRMSPLIGTVNKIHPFRLISLWSLSQNAIRLEWLPTVRWRLSSADNVFLEILALCMLYLSSVSLITRAQWGTNKYELKF